MIPFDVNDAAVRERFLRENVASAIANLTTASVPAWGKMTAQQMVEHVTWAIELSTGRAIIDCSASSEEMAARRVGLYRNGATPRNFTLPAHANGLPPLRHRNLEDAKAALLRELDWFLDPGRDRNAIHVHPLFGPIGYDDWHRTHYKHAYHHLFQFRLVPPTVQYLEQLAGRALPGLEEIPYDGWTLRFAIGAEGYPRRSNSVHISPASTLPLEEKINFCEAEYSARGQRTVFKITDSPPDDLQQLLLSRGYVADCETSVQTVDLSSFSAPRGTAGEIVIDTRMDDSWYQDFARLDEDNPGRAAVVRRILERVKASSAFVRIRRNNETVAIGRGVLDQNWIGLYQIVTHPNFRREGFGTQLTQAILLWGKAHGATDAYLQVMTENAAALRVYQRLGFREQYRYRYLSRGADAARL